MTPPPALIICAPKTWQPCQTPFTLTRITSSHSASVTSTAGRWMHTPALLTSTSTSPSAPAGDLRELAGERLGARDGGLPVSDVGAEGTRPDARGGQLVDDRTARGG